MVKQLHDKPDRNELDERPILSYQAARHEMLKHYGMTKWIYCTASISDPKLRSLILQNGKGKFQQKAGGFEDICNEYIRQSVALKCSELA